MLFAPYRTSAVPLKLQNPFSFAQATQAPTGVTVGVADGVNVGVAVDVWVDVNVRVGVKVAVNVSVTVWVNVALGTAVNVRVEVALGNTGMIGVDDAAGGGEVGDDDEIGVPGVSEGPTPGRITTPSRTLYPSSAISSSAVALIVGPKAVSAAINAIPTKTAIRTYSTNPCPFSCFFFANGLFILFILVSFRKFELTGACGTIPLLTANPQLMQIDRTTPIVPFSQGLIHTETLQFR